MSIRTGWLTTAALGLLLLQSASAPAAAQDVSEELPLLEAEDLGISLARIQRRLDRLPDALEARRLLRLNYYVTVYARAPEVELQNRFDVHNGPVPYGRPTHQEMLRAMRPNEHFPTVADLTPVMGWAWAALRP